MRNVYLAMPQTKDADNSRKIHDLLLQYCGDIQNGSVLILAGDPTAYDSVKNRLSRDSASVRVDVLPLHQIVSDLTMLENQRWTVVCLPDPELEPGPLREVLARVRDLHADRIVHIDCSGCRVSSGHPDSVAGWTLADSLALGFNRISAAEGIDQYEFNKSTYKSAPDWLNARHWANPELWGKHRW